jgi:hypothetical protein
MNSELDELLSRPLPDVPDRGFSARLLAVIARRQIRQARIDTASWIILALAFTVALAVTGIGRELAALALSLSLAVQVGVALTVILLAFAVREAPPRR